MNLKNVLIFGDSYSTFSGYIPHGYDCYYSAEEYGTGVCLVEQTWWHQLIKETDSNLILNDSWSGSTICHTGYENSDCSKTSSFVCRLDKYISEGFFEKNRIDTVFVFGGTNDSWAGSPIGELKFSDWNESDLFSFLPAICCFFDKLKRVLTDNARIVCIVNSDLNPQVTNGMITACKHFGVECIKLENIDKFDGHPTVKGMSEIKSTVIENLSE